MSIQITQSLAQTRNKVEVIVMKSRISTTTIILAVAMEHMLSVKKRGEFIVDKINLEPLAYKKCSNR